MTAQELLAAWLEADPWRGFALRWDDNFEATLTRGNDRPVRALGDTMDEAIMGALTAWREVAAADERNDAECDRIYAAECAQRRAGGVR